MLQKQIKPSAVLQKYIDYYFVVEISSANDFLPRQRVFPTGKMVLVFHYGTPSLIHINSKKPEIENNTVICGQQTSYYDLSLSGNTKMLFVVFKVGAEAFFSLPMNELTNQNIPLNCILGKEADHLEEKIQEAHNLTKRIELIESFMQNKMQEPDINNRRMETVLKTIEYTKAQTNIKQMAGTACLSIKQFERLFVKEIGLKPKQYLRIQRFQNILTLKRNGFDGNFTQLALQTGYYDQSHFIHDFKSITGQNPKAFFEKNKKLQ